MAVTIICNNCGRPLTEPCDWGIEADYDRSYGGRKVTIPKGILVVLKDDDAVDAHQGGKIIGQKVYSRAGSIAANPEDIAPSCMQSAGVDNGCCGSDGMDGPNRACVCGAMVATQWSDCWTHAEIRFLPHAVKASETV